MEFFLTFFYNHQSIQWKSIKEVSKLRIHWNFFGNFFENEQATGPLTS